MRNHSKWVRTQVELLCSLSDKYPLKRYEPPYPPSYGLNGTTTVLPEGWISHQITLEGWCARKKQNQQTSLVDAV